jgi:hypothetical protein
MEDAVRAAVAAIAGSAVRGVGVNGVFDHRAGKLHPIAGTVKDGWASFVDFRTARYIAGLLPGLFNQGTQAHLTVVIEDKRFVGFEQKSKSAFNGTVDGTTVEMFDYGAIGFYSFSVQEAAPTVPVAPDAPP